MGLDYADQRYYASSYGRFNTPDSLASSAMADDPVSWNRYAYVGGDPVNRNDRRGQFWTICSGISDPESGATCDDGDGGLDWWDTPDPCGQLSSELGAGSFSCGSPVPPPTPVQPVTPKCWQNVPNIAATLNNLGTDIEQDVEGGPNGTFSAADLQLLTTDINSDIASEIVSIGGGTTAKPYYIGGHFNLTISAIQIAAFSTSDQQTFSSDFWGGTNDGTRQAASTGLALAGGYTLHSHGGVNSPYSFHFDRFNPQDLVGLVGHGVYDVLGGHLGHPCLDPAWQ
jgi:RHS repeat-associated protein